MAFSELFAGIPVADYPAARDWYERLLGRPADLIPNDNEVAWRLTDAGWIYVVGDPDRAGRALTTVLVDDLDALVDELAGRGFVASFDTVAGVVRKAQYADPDGNRITFAQPG